MGGKDSKPVFLSYEEAVKRVSENELKRLKDAFKRSSTLSGFMTRNVFIREVLGDGVPIKLAEHIFEAFGGTPKGLGFRDLLCGLVLLTKGKDEEKIKFIFGVYANENFTNINKVDMDELILQTEGVVPLDLADLFRESDQVSYEMFRVWVKDHLDALNLTVWLLKDTNHMTMSNDLQTPTFYQTLAGVTHLEEADIIELEKQYWQLKGLSKTGRFDLETFTSIVCPPVPESLCEGLFWAFDENQDNHIDFKELACGISACCRGPTVDKLKFCFKLFDVDHNSLLSKSEALDMMSAMILVRQFNKSPAEQASDGLSDVTAEELAHELLSTHEDDSEECVTQEEYLFWAVKQPLTIDFLNLLIQVCHIVLGLRPQSKDEERDIIIPWLAREERQGLCCGQTWYLVAISWWRQWADYIQVVHDVTIDGGASLNGSRNKDTSSNHSRTNSFSLCPTLIHRPSITQDESISLNSVSRSSESSIISNSTITYATVPRSTTLRSGVSIGANSSSDSGQMSQSMVSYHALSSASGSQASTPSGSPHMARRVSFAARPGPIDNMSLVVPSSRVTTLTNEGGFLKRDRPLARGRDFEIVSESIWKAFSSWYGKPMLALPRSVIIPYPGSVPELELYPTQVKLLRYQINNQRPPNANMFTGMVGGIGGMVSNAAGMAVGPPTSPRRYLAYIAAFSSKHTLRQVYEFLTGRLKINREDMRLWKVKDEQNMQLLEEENKTMEDLAIYENTQILIEVRNKDLTWPEELCQLAKNKMLIDKSQTERGATGLNNLGNTCFMNSALQCISNTYILTVYFTSGLHLYELNRTNPLGARGNLAERYGDLVKDLWSGTAKSIAPLKLRWTVGKYAPCFNGFQQHDSQELLAFVLDGLHEDLNRVHEKPYIELKDSDGRPDEIVAKEAWDNHLLRNQSIIVDLFHGQLKSCVRCIECGHTSVKFDPFTFLSLPLPMESCIHLEIIVVCLDDSCPVKYGLRLSVDERYRSLKKQLSDLCGIPPSRLLLVDVYGALVRSFPQDNAKIKVQLGGNLFAYELPLNLPVSTMTNAVEEKTQQPSQQSTPAHHPHLSHSLHGGGLSQIQRIHARHMTSSSEHLNGTSMCDNDFKPDGNDSDKVAAQPGIMSSTMCQSRGSGDAESAGEMRKKSIDTLDNDSINQNISFSGFLVAVHRKMIHVDVYFLSSQKSRPSLFGTPMILSCDKSTTHHSLYQQVWSLVSRLVSPLPPSEVTTPNHAHDCDDSLGYEYPFTLKAVQKDGLSCAFCPWYRFCRGCPLECGLEPFNCATSFLAVDWEPTALHLRYHASQEKVYVEHESLEISRQLQTEPIGLDTCLKAFTKEEELGEEELYYCSKCKKHRLAAKKLELWSLPPILIIHLKRFQFHNGRWVKSQKIVKFPMHGFDPTNYLVRRVKNDSTEISPSVETTSSNSCDSIGFKDRRKNHNNNQIRSDDLNLYGHQSISGTDINGAGEGDEMEGDCVSKRVDNHTGSLVVNNKVEADSSNDRKNPMANGSAHFIENGPQDGAIKVETNCLSSDDYSNARYNLYAVSSHTGILGGGHYVTYAKNPNKKWYCYNDSSCKEVTEDQVDTNSAYILFYERQGLENSRFMPDTSDKEPQIADNDEEYDKEFKKICVLQ